MIKKDTGSTPLKIGFLGLGWIGRMRMESLIQTGLAEATVVADTNVAQLMSIQTGAPFLCHSLDEL
ncbi:MAG: gfo/Idh/MocA family oxidoreductase, partial [Fibrobacter sp.]|nr:gfo/Idh/MocA family oxidoreductase [Fibrobacter sp.]